MEGVSLWVVPSAADRRVRPRRGGRAVRAGRGQGLPPPDLLRHPGRGEAHLMPSLPPIRPEDEAVARALAAARRVRRARSTTPHDAARFDYLLRLGDDALILGQRLGEWCGHAPALEVDLSLANLALDLIGQATHFLNDAGEVRRARAATATRSPSTATCSISAIACWSSSPTATSPRPWRGSCSISTWQHMLFAAADRLDRPVPRANSPPRRSRKSPITASLRANGRSASATAPRRARGGWPTALDWCWRFVPELFEVDEIAARR